MKILFVCRHNRFRSKVAEAIFNKLNKNKKIKAESAGIVGLEPPVTGIVVKILKEKGYKIVNINSRKINFSTINDYDLLIIVANNVDKKFFKKFKGKIIKWNIKDCGELEPECIKERINKIEKKVKKLVKNLAENF